MKRLTVLLPLLAALHATTAKAACDPILSYQTVKLGVLQQEPSTGAEFDRMMSSLGLTEYAPGDHVWKCENADGTFIASLVPGHQNMWINIDYSPNKPEKVPDALLSILAARAHAEPVGPHWMKFEYHSDESAIEAYKSRDEFDETITINLVGGIYEETQCLIKLRAKVTR